MRTKSYGGFAPLPFRMLFEKIPLEPRKNFDKGKTLL